MGNGNVLSLFGKAIEFASGDQRRQKDVERVLQLIVNLPDCGVSLLDAPKQAMLVSAFPRELWVPQAERYYREVHGKVVNLLPVLNVAQDAQDADKNPEFCWPVFMTPEVGLNRIWAECRNHDYPTNSDYGMDPESRMAWHQRDTKNGPYMVRFRARVEADVENQNLSANQLSERGDKVITFPERLVLGDFVWWMTGGFHLDLLNWTLCAGSRDVHGNVPYVYWYGHRLQVDHCHPGDADGSIRSRSAA